MLLTVRPLAIDTFRENTVLLSRDCRALRPERLAGVRKVEVRGRPLEISRYKGRKGSESEG